MKTIQDITIICAATALTLAGVGTVTGDTRYISASMLAGNTSFLLMNVATSERIKRNKEAIKSNSKDINTLVEEITD